MSLRLLPFRQYDENDVVNLFALESQLALTDTTPGNAGVGDAGVFVEITTGNFNLEPVSYGADSYLGKTDYPFVNAEYPSNPLTISGASSGKIPLGITLNQTAKADENGEKLLYNATKKEELQAVLPGQTVPVLTKGIVTLAEESFDRAGTMSSTTFEASYGVGRSIALQSRAIGNANVGSITGVGPEYQSGHYNFGKIIGTGSRNATANRATTEDQFSGRYIVVKFDCN